MATKMKIIKTSTPSGIKAAISVPSSLNLDERLVEAGLNAFIGGIVASAKETNETERRKLLLRYVASTIAEARGAVRAVSLKATDVKSNAVKAIEELLKSLHSNGNDSQPHG